MLLPSSVIYLNNAATSWPKPPEVRAAVSESLATPFFGSGRTTGGEGRDYVTQAREAVARLLGVTCHENVVFTHNATDSLNILIQGFLTAHPGCHVLTTALEHNSVLRPLHEYQRQNRAILTILPFESGIVRPDAVHAAIRPDTRLMVMTHASNVLGSVQDIDSIGKILHDHDIVFIVDGAQAAGHIPVDLRMLPVDAYVFTGHKGLFGIPGTGGFFIRDPESIPPVRFGGTGSDSSSPFHPTGIPERFEAGTHNYTGLAALEAGVRYIEKTGIATMAEKSEKQVSVLINGMKNVPGVTVYNEHPDLPIVAFNIDNLDNDDVGFMLARVYRIVSRTGLHCSPLVHKAIDGGRGCIRFSPSWFTTYEECRIAADAVQEIAGDADYPVGPA